MLTATAPGDQPLAADAFGRTLTSGWGSADAGGPWTIGTASKFSVSAGLGRTVVTAGQTNSARLPAVSSTDSDLRVTTSVDELPTGGGVYVGIIGRNTGTNLEYQARVKVRPDGSVGLSLLSLPGSATVSTLKAEITVPGAATANSAAVKVRLQVVGVTPTTIRAKAWSATGTEPAAWQLTATDSLAGLQAPGSVGMNAYLSSSSTVTPVTTRFGDFSVLPTNQPPQAAFSGSCAVLTCSVDGGASADPDGAIASYSWAWGDGSVTTGATSSHSYPAAGPYRITLSVTDDDGAAASTGKDVVVTAPPANDPFAADAFARTVAAGWGTADRGGAWSLTGVGSKYSVTAGVASMTAKAGETDAAVLPAVSSSDTDLRVTLTADKLATGNGSYVGVIGRRVGTNAEYQARLRVRADGSVAVSLLALNGSPTVIVLRPEVAPSGVSVAGGAKVTARVQVTGTSPTTFRMKVWPAAGTEPAAWQVSIADSTSALQARGAVGLQVYVSSGSTVTPVTLRASEFSARPAIGP